MIMTKDDIMKAIEKYNEERPNEYGWICYSFIIRGDKIPTAYIKYENDNCPYEYRIYCENSLLWVEPNQGCINTSFRIDNFDSIVDIIYSALLYMRFDIEYPIWPNCNLPRITKRGFNHDTI